MPGARAGGGGGGGGVRAGGSISGSVDIDTSGCHVKNPKSCIAVWVPAGLRKSSPGESNSSNL